MKNLNSFFFHFCFVVDSNFSPFDIVPASCPPSNRYFFRLGVLLYLLEGSYLHNNRIRKEEKGKKFALSFEENDVGRKGYTAQGGSFK